MLFSPELAVYHERREGLWSHARQIFGYAAGRAQNFKRHPAEIRWAFFMPSLFLLYLATMPLALWFPLWAAPLAFYAAVAAGVGLVTAVRVERAAAAPLGAVLFAVTHVAYGLGFLSGLLNLSARARPVPDTARVELR